jgi:methionyl-tRNA formyltransferase
MRIVFFGTPEYVLPVLKAVHKKFKEKDGTSPISAVVTQEPKPVGRSQFVEYSPIDTWAYKRDIPKFFSAKDIVKEKIEADIGVLAAYGEIIPKDVIEYFPQGILNIHPSLLPKYRGASPIQGAILAGEKETGVTVIKLDEKLDHGPVVSFFKEEVNKNDTTKELRERLFARSADFLSDLIPPYISRKVSLKAQNHKEATYTTLIRKADGFIEPSHFKNALEGKTTNVDWDIGFMKDFAVKPSPEVIERFIRAMHPWPQAWTNVNVSGETLRLKILSAKLKEGSLLPEMVHLEGKSAVTWKQFKEGYTSAMFV